MRHHVAKKKHKKARKGTRDDAERKFREEDLDRFAGSSEDEDDHDDDAGDRSEDEDAEMENEKDVGEKPQLKKMTRTKRVAFSSTEKGSAADEMDADEEDDSSVSDGGEDGEDLDEKGNKHRADRPTNATSAAGMADAMSRILGAASAGRSSLAASSTVLSRTVTPLQKRQREERETELNLRRKRKERRETNLTALHMPLSAATSRVPVGGAANEVAREIERERMHRRVATRGVVALFNAISKHKASQLEKDKAKSTDESSIASKNAAGGKVQAMTKHGFIDMLKSTASASTEEKARRQQPVDSSTRAGEKGRKKGGSSSGGKRSASAGGWNALRDDFMMNSKLKNWDEDLSGEDEDSDQNRIGEPIGGNDDFGSGEDE